MSKKNTPQAKPNKPTVKPVVENPKPKEIRSSRVAKTLLPPLMYSQKGFYILLGLIIVPCLIAYSPGVVNGFVWDDYFYIVNNNPIHSFSFNNLKEVLTGFVLGNYHPLTVLSNYIEYLLVGETAWVYHLNNLIIHLVNSWLVYRLIYKLYDNFLVACITSVLFAIHPLHVESVAWAAERKDVLYTLFLLLSFLKYLQYIEEDRNRKQYLLCLLFFVLSCLSKGMAVVLPVVFLLTDLLMLQRKINVALLLEKAPFFAVSLGAGIMSIIAQRSAGADATNVLSQAYLASERFFFICYGLLFYWIKMVFPFNLLAFYPYPKVFNHQMPSQYYLAFVAIIALGAAIYWLGRKNKAVWWGGAYFFIVILPVSQILPIGSALMADRYFYVSSIGPLFLLGIAADRLYRQGDTTHKVAPIIGGILLLLLTFLSFQRARSWETPFTVFSSILEKHPDDPMVMSNIGWYYYSKKDTAQTVQYFEKTIAQNFKTADICYTLGQIYFAQKEYKKCIANFEEAIKLKPSEMKPIYWMLGTAAYYTDNYDQGIEYSKKALEVNDKNANAWNIIGLCSTKKGSFDEAEKAYLKAKEIEPKFYDPYVNLGHLYNLTGDHTKELAILEAAIKTDPKATLAYKNMGVAYMAMNQEDKAIEYWKRGIKADPKDGSFDYNIGLRFAYRNDIPEAIKWYQQAARKGEKSAIDLLKARNVPY